MSSDPPLPLLHQDEDIVALDKPAWSVVHPTPGARDARVLLHELRDQLGQRLHPVHRLDRQTSGVLVFARGPQAASALCAQIREGLWRKTYLGLCRGVLRESLHIDHPVRCGEARRPAETLLDPLEIFCQRYTLLRATPLTGRQHQIRYHLKHAAHPLVGDSSYGQGTINRFFRSVFGLGRMFLHAETLRFPHPTRNVYVELSAPLPPELVAVLERLRIHDGPVP